MKNISVFFLLLSIIIFNVNCQTYICKDSDSSGLKVGDKAYLCIHILQTNTRIAFPLEVDEYSVASIKGFYEQISSNSTNNYEFLAQVGKITSVFPSVRKYILLK